MQLANYKLWLFATAGVFLWSLLYSVSSDGIAYPERLRPHVYLQFSTLSSGLREIDIIKRFPTVHFSCQTENSSLGDHVCRAGIGLFNGVPARHLAFFFKGDRLWNVKLGLPAREHAFLLRQLKSRYGSGHVIKNQAGASPLLAWYLPSGIVSSSTARVPAGQEASVLWTGADAIYEHVTGRALSGRLKTEFI